MTGPSTVWIYVDTRKLVGDRDFADEDAAEAWFQRVGGCSLARRPMRDGGLKRTRPTV
jgi:hypothetical protein